MFGTDVRNRQCSEQCFEPTQLKSLLRDFQESGLALAALCKILVESGGRPSRDPSCGLVIKVPGFSVPECVLMVLEVVLVVLVVVFFVVLRVS